jgi:UDPglucose 6-dehydrogenase
MKVSIYGAGYVGLIAGVCFANLGHKVLCFDINSKRIDDLRQEKPVLYEQDFDDFLKEALRKKTISFTTNIQEATSFSNVHLMCVGTPSGEDGSANLSFLYSAVEDLAANAHEPFIIINKSTVPVGTAIKIKEKVDNILKQIRDDVTCEVVSCPEFLAQGTAIYDFMHPQRVIVGTDSDRAFKIVKDLYSPILESEEMPSAPLIRMSSTSAEMTKYASNLFLATKVSFMNEMSRIAELTGADISQVINGMVLDKRIGPGMANPGCGFGGSCFPKDLQALIHQAELSGYTPPLLRSVLEVNINQKNYFMRKIFSFFNFEMEGKTIAVWGLSFKAKTDDLRESISCYLIETFLKVGAIIKAYDPVANKNAIERFKLYPNFQVCKSKEEAIQGADALLVMTEWPEFHCLDTELIKKSMNFPVLFDGRNMYDQNALAEAGIFYFAIGKGCIPMDHGLAA